jgi:DNA-binding Lrp family transcriptional regulator
MNTEFKKSLITKLEEKGLNKNTINLYIRNLEKLNEDFPLNNLNFLKDIEGIKSKLAGYKNNTIRGYLISIVVALKMDNKKSMAKVLKVYNDWMNELADKIKEDYKDGKYDDKYNDNKLSFDEVLKVLETLGEKVDKFVNNKVINEHQYNILLEYLILALYCLTEPRRNLDYQKCYLVSKIDDKLDTDCNYCDVDNFLFNIYKTSKTHGQQLIKIGDELKEVIKKYIKHHPLIKNSKIKKGDKFPLLVYYNGESFDSVNSITRILNKIFGQKIGSSQLRKIYVTNKFGDKSELHKLLEEQKEVADKMGQTVDTQNLYYIKGDKK